MILYYFILLLHICIVLSTLKQHIKMNDNLEFNKQKSNQKNIQKMLFVSTYFK